MQQNNNLVIYTVIGVAFGVLLVLLLVLTAEEPEAEPVDIDATVDARVAIALTEAGISGTAEAQRLQILTEVAETFPTATLTPSITPSPTSTPTLTPMPTPIALQVGRTELIIGAASFSNRVVAWSGDGTAIAGGDEENKLVIGTLADGQVVSLGTTNGAVTSIDWSPDNRRIAVGDDTNSVFIWDLVSSGAR